MHWNLQNLTSANAIERNLYSTMDPVRKAIKDLEKHNHDNKESVKSDTANRHSFHESSHQQESFLAATYYRVL